MTPKYLDPAGDFLIAVDGTAKQLAVWKLFEHILYGRVTYIGGPPVFDFTAEDLMPIIARFWGAQPSILPNEPSPYYSRGSSKLMSNFTNPQVRQIAYTAFQKRLLQGDYPASKKWLHILNQRAHFVFNNYADSKPGAFIGEEAYPIATEYFLQNIVLKDKALKEAFSAWDESGAWLKKHEMRLSNLEGFETHTQLGNLNALRYRRDGLELREMPSLPRPRPNRP